MFLVIFFSAYSSLTFQIVGYEEVIDEFGYVRNVRRLLPKAVDEKERSVLKQRHRGTKQN